MSAKHDNQDLPEAQIDQQISHLMKLSALLQEPQYAPPALRKATSIVACFVGKSRADQSAQEQFVMKPGIRNIMYCYTRTDQERIVAQCQYKHARQFDRIELVSVSVDPWWRGYGLCTALCQVSIGFVLQMLQRRSKQMPFSGLVSVQSFDYDFAVRCYKKAFAKHQYRLAAENRHSNIVEDLYFVRPASGSVPTKENWLAIKDDASGELALQTTNLRWTEPIQYRITVAGSSVHVCAQAHGNSLTLQFETPTPTTALLEFALDDILAHLNSFLPHSFQSVLLHGLSDSGFEQVSDLLLLYQQLSGQTEWIVRATDKAIC